MNVNLTRFKLSCHFSLQSLLRRLCSHAIHCSRNFRFYTTHICSQFSLVSRLSMMGHRLVKVGLVPCTSAKIVNPLGESVQPLRKYKKFATLLIPCDKKHLRSCPSCNVFITHTWHHSLRFFRQIKSQSLCCRLETVVQFVKPVSIFVNIIYPMKPLSLLSSYT